MEINDKNLVTLHIHVVRKEKGSCTLYQFNVQGPLVLRNVPAAEEFAK